MGEIFGFMVADSFLCHCTVVAGWPLEVDVGLLWGNRVMSSIAGRGECGSMGTQSFGQTYFLVCFLAPKLTLGAFIL